MGFPQYNEEGTALREQLITLLKATLSTEAVIFIPRLFRAVDVVKKDSFRVKNEISVRKDEFPVISCSRGRIWPKNSPSIQKTINSKLKHDAFVDTCVST